jgi:hypothetical protein
LGGNGPAGSDYTLLISTDLASWEVLRTANSLVTPLTLAVTNLPDALRFYRSQLGP